MRKVRWFSLVLVACMAIHSSDARGDVVTQWNFNSTNDDANSGTGTTSPSVGAGVVALLGNTTADFAGGTLNPSQSSDPAAGANNSAWNVRTFSSPNQFSDGIQANVSTAGFSDIVISWDQRTSNSSSKYVAFFYSTDGSNWVQATGDLFTAGTISGSLNPAGDSVLGNLFVNGSGDRFHNQRSVNLSSIAGANDNSNFAFRIVSAFDPNTSAFTGTNAAFATTGTWRFDMLTVSGITAIPEPSSIATLGVLSAIGMMRARRRRAAQGSPSC